MSLQAFIQSLQDLPTQRDAVTTAYSYLSQKYFGDKIKRFTYIHYLWEHIDLEKMREKDGPVQCMHINRLFQYVLVESGHFRDEDIQLLRTFPHQYVKVLYNDGTSVCVDIWAKNSGVPFGDYAKSGGKQTK